jgi:hypothetical protein
MINLSKIEIKSAQVISYLLHPIFYPLVGLYLIFNAGTYLQTMNIENKQIIFIIAGFSTCLLPLLSLPFFIYRKVIRNVEMETRSDRTQPLLLFIIFYYMGYYFLTRLPIPVILSAYFSSLVILISVTFLITLRWKISFHLTGAGGLLGSLLAISYRYNIQIELILILIILLIGIVTSARYMLKTHTTLQLMVGLVTGFLICFNWMYFA